VSIVESASKPVKKATLMIRPTDESQADDFADVSLSVGLLARSQKSQEFFEKLNPGKLL
jgi:hypothetical protein